MIRVDLKARRATAVGALPWFMFAALVMLSGCTYPSLNTLPADLRVQDNRVEGMWLEERTKDSPRNAHISVVKGRKGTYLGTLAFDSRFREFGMKDLPESLDEREREEVFDYLLENVQPLYPQWQFELFRVDEQLVVSATIARRALALQNEMYQGFFVMPVHQFGLVEFVDENTLRIRVLSSDWTGTQISDKKLSTTKSDAGGYTMLSSSPHAIVDLIRSALRAGDDPWVRDTIYIRSDSYFEDAG